MAKRSAKRAGLHWNFLLLTTAVPTTACQVHTNTSRRQKRLLARARRCACFAFFLALSQPKRILAAASRPTLLSAGASKRFEFLEQDSILGCGVSNLLNSQHIYEQRSCRRPFSTQTCPAPCKPTRTPCRRQKTAQQAESAMIPCFSTRTHPGLRPKYSKAVSRVGMTTQTRS